MKRILSFAVAICMVLSVCFVSVSVFADNAELQGNALPAFPGAEGGGKFTKGARGVLDSGEGKLEVYHVTNLNSEGPGSFTDAISQSGRIVVFDVGGVIDVPSTVYINNDNITILGQTAPGDGITLTGGDLRIGNGVKNVIIRYMRVRPTNKNGQEVDGLGGQWNSDIIIDHCSTSWCVDEGLTLYAGSAESDTYEQGKRLTVQNTITSESMRMSGHFKGAHGYGAIIGGTNATYYRNLFAHHDSRSPRLDRVLQNTDFRNNVVYNWGVTNSAYGGEPTSPHNKVINPSKVNYSNNYYKYGPSTVSGKRYRIYDFAKMAKVIDGVTYKSKFYMTDNYVVGSSTVTNNNWSNDGTNSAADQVEKVDTPFSLGDDLYPDLNITEGNILLGKDVMSNLLPDVGANLPKRDATDARVIADVLNQTGRIINNEEEVGGLSDIESSQRTFEIPADWKAANGMGAGAAEADIVTSGVWAGYTWVEAYVNDWTEQQSAQAPTNPEIVVTSPVIASINSTVDGQTVQKGNWTVIKDTDTLSYKASAKAADGTNITKMELYDDESLIKTYDGVSPIDDSLPLGIGTHYLSCVAHNDKGEKTRSTISIVYVTGTNKPEGWTQKQIGPPAYSGKGIVSYDADTDIYTMGGSGKIGGKSDKLDFMYKEVTGDFDISLKMEDIMANENGAVLGLMLRESLDAGSRMAALVDGWIKYGRNDRIVARTTKNANIATDSENSNSTDNKMGIFMRGKEGEIVSGNILGEHPYDTAENGKYHLPNYLRIQRSGDNLLFSVSDSGTDWKDNARQPYTMKISGLANKLYVGVAIDSQQGQSDASPQAYYSMAKFSNLKLENQSNFDPGATDEPVPTPDAGLTDYPDWNVGQVSAAGTDGDAVQIEYEGKTAVKINSRNIYTALSEVKNSDIVTFNTDMYLSSSDKNGFRIYLENDKAKNYQDSSNSLGGVFAEVLNSSNGSLCVGPAMGAANAVYDFSNEQAGWFNIDITLDYTKESTSDNFITVIIKNAAGEEVVNTSMPAIDGIDSGLKQIRLIARSAQPYFANMAVETKLAGDVIVNGYQKIVDGTGSVNLKNNSNEPKSVQVFVAQYEANGKIIKNAKTKTAVLDGGAEQTITFDGLLQDGAKVFVWDENLNPYCSVFNLTAE